MLDHPNSQKAKELRTLILEAAARGYCIAENSHKELDSTLLEAVVDEIMMVLPQPNGPSEQVAESAPVWKLEEHGRDWRWAANRLGELMCATGPRGYYEFSPEQWLSWAKDQIPQPEAGAEPQWTPTYQGDNIWTGAVPPCWLLVNDVLHPENEPWVTYWDGQGYPLQSNHYRVIGYYRTPLPPTKRSATSD